MEKPNEQTGRRAAPESEEERRRAREREERALFESLSGGKLPEGAELRPLNG